MKLKVWSLLLTLPTLFFADYLYAAQKVALVIGNGAYGIEGGILKDSPNDAVLMATTLRSLNFDVVMKINANQKMMKRLIREFGKKIKTQKDTIGLFYYSGHGMQINGRNYMIPIAEHIEDESDVQDSGVGVDYVLTKMRVSNNRTNIVILDACRNNPFEKKFKSPIKGLNRMDAPKSTLIAFAAEPYKVALHGPGKHSYFTESLAHEIVKPNISAIEMLRNVRKSVVEKTNGKQFPIVEDRLIEPFYFQATVKEVPPPVSTSIVSQDLFQNLSKDEINLPSTQQSPTTEGILLDSRTSLLWTSTDNGKDVSWDFANQYCSELRLGGYTDWQLPSKTQLSGIYDPNNVSGFYTSPSGYRREIHTIKGFHLSNYAIWTAKDEAGIARFVRFTDGESYRYRPENLNKAYHIALCVRQKGRTSQ